MSGSVTLLQLRNSAKDRSNMENSTLINDAQWNEYINKSKDALYDLLISAYADEYYIKTPAYVFSLVSGTLAYALPTDFYKMISVYLKTGTDYFALNKFSNQRRNRNNYFPYRTELIGFRYDYRVSGENILFDPLPTTTDQIELNYIPLATNLAADIDTLKGFNGWEEYIILDVAIKAMRKEESDTQDLERDLMRITERLEKMSDSRDIGHPSKIIDSSRRKFGVEFYN